MQEKRNSGTMSRRQFLWAAAATTMLAACAPVGAPAAGGGQSGGSSPAAEPVTLILNMRAGGDTSEPAIYVRRPETFMKDNPNIKVELGPIPGNEYEAKALTAASAGTLGDVMWTSDVFTFHSRLVKLGVIAAVDDQLEKAGHSKDEWIPAAIQTLTHDGKLYGLPKCAHPGEAYLWLNNDLFQKAGLTLPENGATTTMEDVTAWGEKLASGPEDARDIYGIGLSNTGIQAIVNGVRQFGTYENNEEGTKSLADNDQWMAWTAWNKNFYDKKFAPIEASLPTGGSNALFIAGKLGIRHNQRSTYRAIIEGLKQAQTPFEWTIVQAPRGPKPLGWGASVDTHSATAGSKHPDEAFALSYALADDIFTRYVVEDQGYLTARVKDLETAKDLLNPFIELQYKCMTESEAFRQPANSRGTEVQTVYANELSKLWLGDEELTAGFMANMKAAADEVMAKPF